jgi:hypothetical protein
MALQGEIDYRARWGAEIGFLHFNHKYAMIAEIRFLGAVSMRGTIGLPLQSVYNLTWSLSIRRFPK